MSDWGQHLELRQTRDKGLGVFSRKRFQVGALIMPCAGNITTMAPKTRAQAAYTLKIGEGLFLGSSGTYDDHVNHSCEPNAEIVVFPNGAGCEMRALRDIAIGEEITVDYTATASRPEWKVKCACGAQTCRGEFAI